MVTLQNTTEAVKVLKANGMPTLRVIPGFNYVDIEPATFGKYLLSEVNKSIVKESIVLIDFELVDEDKEEAEKALATNKKLNKAQKVIDKQNKQILEKDKDNDTLSKNIKDQDKKIEMLMKEIEKLKKGKK
jgi:septal ring factor EnvC (AmiA/AmiB activator)